MSSRNRCSNSFGFSFFFFRNFAAYNNQNNLTSATIFFPTTSYTPSKQSVAIAWRIITTPLLMQKKAARFSNVVQLFGQIGVS